MPRFDLLVFIGRFQPPHAGHLAVVRAALRCARRVVVLCGSTDEPRSRRNPWTFEERARMLRAALATAEHDRVSIRPVRDVRYDDERWRARVRAVLDEVCREHHPGAAPPIGLIGCAQHGSGYYRRCFPDWETVDVPAVAGASGTAIREALFGDPPGTARADLAVGVPAEIVPYLGAFMTSAAMAGLRREADYVNEYRRAWAGAPFPPIFVTVDAVVVHGGQVLLVERGGYPGKGLMALPGGFVDQAERLQEACLRELREETRIAVDDTHLAAAIERHEVFDDPYRSARGRTITHVYLFRLAPSVHPPTVAGGDDARAARWVPREALDPGVLFEDHYAILQVLLGLG